MTNFSSAVSALKTPTLFIAPTDRMDKTEIDTTSSFPELMAADFEVQTKPLFSEDRSPNCVQKGMAIPVPETVGRLIARTDTDLPLGVVGGAYHTVQNRTLHEAVQRAFDNCLISQIANQTVLKEKICRDGAFVRLEYQNPALSGTIDQLNGTKTQANFMVVVQNTHGGTSVRVKAASVDTSCDNILIYGSNVESSARHTENFSTAEMEEFMQSEIHGFRDRVTRMRKWAMTPITTDQASKALSQSGHLSNTQCGDIMDQFAEEVEARGKSVWSLYAACTSFSTHNNERFYVRNSGNVNNEAEALAKREDQIAKVIGSRLFSLLSA
jgi:hypothetical protein